MVKEYNLQRFIDAQEISYPIAFKEMQTGRKRSHWIWYIFPQQKGLGRSWNSEFYGLDGKEEAIAYLKHPVLGTRLRDITKLLISHNGTKTVHELMGSSIDVLKLKTSMELFNSICPNDVFQEVLTLYFE